MILQVMVGLHLEDDAVKPMAAWQAMNTTP
jgi:hypothetical protein